MGVFKDEDSEQLWIVPEHCLTHNIGWSKIEIQGHGPRRHSCLFKSRVVWLDPFFSNEDNIVRRSEFTIEIANV
jgi:hypothetical protein